MPDKILTPKFLNATIAQLAVQQAIRVVTGPDSLTGLLKRQAFHIVVLGPSMRDDRETDYADWPAYQIQPALIYEHGVGKGEGLWTDKYDEVARCKALQLWHGRQDSGTDIAPHLLFPGDTIYWGGVKRQGIVVACSGVQPWFDRMIANLVADMIIGLSYDAWMRSNDRMDVERKIPGAGWIT